MEASLLSDQALLDQRSIACQVFLTMAGIEVVTSSETTFIKDPISSMLRYSGAEESSILIECSPELAYQFTAGLMSVNCPISHDDDVSDSMGELVNMIGGNLKGLMHPDTCLSVPQVLRSAGLAEYLAANVRLSQIHLAADAGTCAISILKPRS